MKKLILLAALTTSANAGIINHNGMDWMSFNDTHQMSPTAALAAHTGWRHASRSETGNLLASFWGGKYSGFSNDNASGAHAFLRTFGSLMTHAPETYRTGLRYSYFIFGDTPTCGPSLREYCTGSVSYFDNQTYKHLHGMDVATGEMKAAYTAGSGPGGFFSEEAGLNAGLTDYNIGRSMEEASREGVAHLLVRKTEAIPEPTTFPLLLAGLFGLLWLKRRVGE